MSIAQEGRNINRGERPVKVMLFLLIASLFFGISASIGIGFLFEYINQPVPIKIECSKEVLEGLRATSSPPIPKVKARK